jgi:hypothetical protein
MPRRPLLAAFLLLAGCGSHVVDERGMIRSPKIEGWTARTDEIAFRPLHKDAAILYQKDAAMIALWYSPERSGFGLMTDYSSPQTMTSWVNERASTNGVPPTILDSQAMIVSGWKAHRLTYEAGGQRVTLLRANAPQRWFAVECALPSGQDPTEADQALATILSKVRFQEQQVLLPRILTLGPGFTVTMLLVLVLRRWLKK